MQETAPSVSLVLLHVLVHSNLSFLYLNTALESLPTANTRCGGYLRQVDTPLYAINGCSVGRLGQKASFSERGDACVGRCPPHLAGTANTTTMLQWTVIEKLQPQVPKNDKMEE